MVQRREGEAGDDAGVDNQRKSTTSREKRRRNRVPVSCFSCRALKTKCDGIRPTCATCTHNERTCTYLQQGIAGSAHVADTMVVSRQYLKGLEQRIASLERRESASVTGTPLPPTGQVPENNHPASIGASSHRRASRQPPFDGTQEESPSSVVADADVSLGGVAFAQLILNALHGRGSLKAQSMPSDKEVREEPVQLSDEDLYSVPLNASELLDQFFSFRHPLSPVFHVPTVRPLFAGAIHCRPEERAMYRPTLVVLNMIFALCTSHWLIVSEDTVENHRAARRHYDIAMRLMQPNLLRDWSLEHVQALLIGARYLQGSSCAVECWNVLGLAIRIAYGLCLHRDPPEADPPPLRETKRRVWYAAYTLDRLMSTVYERPAAIRSAECSVMLPEDLDDDFIRVDGLLYPMPRRPSTMTFSIEVIKLYRIMEVLMTGLAGDVHNSRKMVQLVTSLHETYRKWHRALPECLVLDHNNPQEQPWILALRGNMVRILIHRQSLALTLNGLVMPQEAEDVAVVKALQQSRTICVSAAIETVDIVALRHEETKKTLGLNWFNIYYLFNAVIVLVSHLADPVHSNDRTALAKVELALRMIQSMSRNHAFAARAHSFLQRVLDHTCQPTTQRHGQREEDVLGNILPLPSFDLPAEMQDVLPSAANMHASFGIPEEMANGPDLFQGRFDAKDFALAPWSFDDQWFY
ncbi:fungal-specific transcription factor domain-containing protein [Coniochaeta sp. 2T2.1]|nr:fungal-specific transcription factor domain-containing protein [Coniochaeta sp. 2T2.1]